MSEYRRVTRSDKHTKRRKNNRNILFLIVLAIIFVIILFTLLFSNNKDESVQEDQTMDAENNTNEDDFTDQEISKDPSTDETIDDDTMIDDVDEIEDIEDVVIQKVESTDENVIEAYTGNWPPIETSQEEPHTVNYNEGSDDRKEIKQAVSIVTGISKENIVEHWVGNNGDQQVVATVSKKDTEDFYHVYVAWVENEGWQVTKVERIKEFEKK